MRKIRKRESLPDALRRIASGISEFDRDKDVLLRAAAELEAKKAEAMAIFRANAATVR